MNDNHIIQYFHCKQCLDELPEDMTPQAYSHNEVGFTEVGFQVRCIRHDMNIAHFDLQGAKVRPI